jgi:hypothetical protein
MEVIEERSCQLEDLSVEIIQPEKQRDNRVKKLVETHGTKY